MARVDPYGAFNFVVKMDGQDVGGFSDVSGLTTELKLSEYREGNERENHVRKIPGMHTVGDVTLKRGIVNSHDFWAWIQQSRSPSGTRGATVKRTVVITLLDESGTPVQSWQLQQVIPMKYTGPTLAAKGGSDVAMEEIVLSAEGLILMDSPSA